MVLRDTERYTWAAFKKGHRTFDVKEADLIDDQWGCSYANSLHSL